MNTYAKWEITRVFRMMAKLFIFYPVMAVCLIPYCLFIGCRCGIARLENLWWE